MIFINFSEGQRKSKKVIVAKIKSSEGIDAYPFGYPLFYPPYFTKEEIIKDIENRFSKEFAKYWGEKLYNDFKETIKKELVLCKTN
jgi:hypothetical protein